MEGFSGDGGPAIDAELDDPFGVAVGSNGDIFFADRGDNRIRRIANGVIATVAGDGKPAYSGDGGPAASAQLFNRTDVAVTGTGALYLADFENQRVRRVDVGGTETPPRSGPAFRWRRATAARRRARRWRTRPGR